MSDTEVEQAIKANKLCFLGACSLTFGDPTLGDLVNLSNTTGLTSVSPSLGMVNFAEVSLDNDTALNAAQPSSFILATLNFKALTAATNSPINLSVKDLSDENTNPLTVAGTPGGVSVTVTSSPVKIPEPIFSPLGLGLTKEINQNTALNQGQHTLSFFVKDQWNNATNFNLKFTLDSNSPLLNVALTTVSTDSKIFTSI